MRRYLVDIEWMDGRKDSWRTVGSPVVRDRQLELTMMKENQLLDPPVVGIPLCNVRTWHVTEVFS